MASALKIGVAGLGNVGAAVVRLLQENGAILSARAGRDIVVTAVSARDAGRDRGLNLQGITWYNDPQALLTDANVDVVVELMGGADGAAYQLVSAALKSGKPVVSANKALLASRGEEILSLSAASKGGICFEAAVAGGIPIIKALREGFAANQFTAIYGILNGTCNFILSEMTATGRAFPDVLKDAQQKGYAEADPSFDVDGIDAAHKLSILSGICFSCLPDAAHVSARGIRHISDVDIGFAAELGFKIKLLGVAKKTTEGVLQSVEPCLVPVNSPIASVDGAMNAIYVDCSHAGKMLLMGAGAGGKATASAVVADIVDVARGRVLPMMGVPADKVSRLKPAALEKRVSSYYLRFMVIDQPGVVADISAILRDLDISLETVLQRGRAPGLPVPLVVTTHDTSEGCMQKALQKTSQLKSITELPCVMRIENFS